MGWCASEGITANQSQEKDNMGWDFILEFPIEKMEGEPRDIASYPIKCLVQVKATDKNSKRKNITISNLEKLVKTPFPVFFCFIEFDNKDIPQSAYIVPLGKDIITKTLKRIRDLDNEGKGNSLNKYSMSITYNKNDRLETTTGYSLRISILKHIPNTLEKYIEEKSNFIRKIGFEDGIGELKINLYGEKNIRDFIDLTLGIRDEVFIKSSEYRHKRFGTLSPEPLWSNTSETVLTLKPNSIPVTLRFKKNKFDQGIILDARLFFTPISFSNEENFPQLRIQSDFLEIICTPPITNKKESNTKAKFYFDSLDKKTDLYSLKQYLLTIEFFEERSLYSIIEIHQEQCEYPIEIKISDLKSIFPEYPECLDIVRKASFICEKFRIQEKTIILQLTDLIKAHSEINLLYEFLCQDPQSIKVSFEVESKDFDITKKACYASFCGFRIGTLEFVFYLAIVGSIMDYQSNKYELLSEDIVLGHPIISQGKKIHKKSILEGLYDFTKDLEEMDLIVFSVN